MRSKIRQVVVATIVYLALGNAHVAAQAQRKAVIAYYSGSVQALDSFDARNMTHLIYCFGHLKGNRYYLDNATDTLLIKKMVAKKKQNPQLTVLLSLGGWGGCKTCSDVFGSVQGRHDFVQSVNETLAFFKADGIDLDWEYPTVEGYPEHRFSPNDKAAFTALLSELRETLGTRKTITFAAGGFQKYLDEAVDWKAVVAKVDYINLMTYDLVSGYATVTGHHTALYSTPQQHESTDNCVQYLLKKGIDPGKLIIGAAFYGRTWEGVLPENNGLYQPGKFKDFIGYNEFSKRISAASGFTIFWDSTAKAPYAYNVVEKIFATFDDKHSIEAKTQYVLHENLGGIMFWQLGDDTAKNGLLQTINTTLQAKGARGSK
jgi:chitinase